MIDTTNQWGEKVCSFDTCEVANAFVDVFCQTCRHVHVCGELNQIERQFFTESDDDVALSLLRGLINKPCNYTRKHHVWKKNLTKLKT